MRLPRNPNIAHPVLVNRGWQGRALGSLAPETPPAEARPAFKRLAAPPAAPPAEPKVPPRSDVTAPRMGTPVGPVLVTPPPLPAPEDEGA